MTAWIGERITQVYEPRFKAALDARERDKLNHRMLGEIRALRDQVVVFDGKVTGFEASVVQGEFAANSKESILLFRDGTVDHYLFFSGGILWKYARPLRPTDAFGTRLMQWKADQGPPTAQREFGGAVNGATWRGVDYILRVEDRRLVSAADLLVLEWRKVEGDVKARRDKARADDAASKSGDDLRGYIE